MPETVTPAVLWAQRSNKTDPAKNIIYLTISAPDVTPESLKIDQTPTSITFSGQSQLHHVDYHVSLEFFKEIDESQSKISHTPNSIQLVLRKKEVQEEYWPRLTKNAAKLHFLKTDFNQWVDEDEQDGAPEDDLADMGGMGGMGGMPGMPGMGGLGDMSEMMGGGGGDFGGIDFSKLGGGGGAMGADDDDIDVDDDDDMPSLAGEDGSDAEPDADADAEAGAEATKAETVEPSSKAKIEEIS
ncbi:hypothetical protein K3495_g5688 [Podosphaera aphanis]|nr:hypothetical protein K3495_g5688 [Podosphaera aphanis]